MSDDAAFDEIRDTLWYQLACRCHHCGTELDLSDLERVRDRDAMAWSRVATERAVEQGWQPVQGEIGVICPACAVRKN
jgi:hypothetical protein